MTRRWDPINDRRADVLERIADGDIWAVPREVDTEFHAAMGISVAL